MGSAGRFCRRKESSDLALRHGSLAAVWNMVLDMRPRALNGDGDCLNHVAVVWLNGMRVCNWYT